MTVHDGEAKLGPAWTPFELDDVEMALGISE